MTDTQPFMDEAAICFGKMLEKGQVLSATEVYWNAAICRNIIAQALLAAEQRGREMEREAVSTDAKRLLDYLRLNAPVGDEVSAEIGRALMALAGERHKVTGEPFTHPLVRSRTEGNAEG